MNALEYAKQKHANLSAEIRVLSKQLREKQEARRRWASEIDRLEREK